MMITTYIVRLFRHGTKPRRELLGETDCGGDISLAEEVALRTAGPNQSAQIVKMSVEVVKEVEMPHGRCWFCVHMALPCAKCSEPIPGELERPLPPEGSGCVFCDLRRPHGMNKCGRET